MSDELYKTLNVDKKATKKQIKDSFRKMAKEYHPDKNPGSDNDKFVAINNAYSILKNDSKREEYDRTGNVNQQDESTNPLAIIAKLFLKLLDDKNINISKTNIVKYIKDNLMKKKETHKEFIKSAEKYRGLMEKVVSRIEKQKNSAPLFSNIIEDRISLINKDIEKNKKEIESIDESLKILKSYKDNISVEEFVNLGSVFQFRGFSSTS